METKNVKRLVSVAIALCLAFALSAPALAASSTSKLLSSIDRLARQGRVLNSGFRVHYDTIDVVEDALGEPDDSSYIASAKGTYWTYDAHNLVVGFGKGDLVFELRSSDSKLGAIKLSDITKKYGKADHVAVTGGEKFVSYVLGGGIHIKFVFSATGKNPALDHYCVLWPKGTANMMADDPGRAW